MDNCYTLEEKGQPLSTQNHRVLAILSVIGLQDEAQLTTHKQKIGYFTYHTTLT